VGVELLPQCRGRHGGAGGGASGTHHRVGVSRRTWAMRRGLFTIVREADGEAEADVDQGGERHQRHDRRGPWSRMLRRPVVRA
jgi:hypothetical protein